MRKPSLSIIFFTVFIDLIGFGIVMPLLPLYSAEFGAPGWMNGAIVASFSLMQFLFAPAWGKLSDRIGRRPVLLISNAGSTIAYGMFGFASGFAGQQALWLLLASRIFAGICGANLSVASAYIADVSPPEKRSKSMGLIGMAFGLGFIFGPALGSFSAGKFGLAGPGWVAAAICGVNFLFTLTMLVESLKPSSEPKVRRVRFEQWAHTFKHPTIGFLVGLYFFATFAFACFEVTIGLLLEHKFNYGPKQVGYFITYCGLLSALLQGGGIGPLIKRFGERKLLAMALVVVAAGLLMIPYVSTISGMLLALGVFAAGSGIHRPPLFGLISILTPESEQGEAMGVTQSAGSLARIVAPVFAITLYEVRPPLPYVICAAVALLAGVVAWSYLNRPEIKGH
ncbi:MAG TPA: MFS transporter [Verrucomicrobiae bacterium]|jgi:MFS family permease|nr:MFS transporter [Verrucomicrobiae bacterium]